MGKAENRIILYGPDIENSKDYKNGNGFPHLFQTFQVCTKECKPKILKALPWEHLSKEIGDNMVKCISYWDCSDWNFTIEVMNMQHQDALYKITVYDPDGNQSWQGIRSLAPYETERINIDHTLPPEKRKEGLVVVEPAECNRNEFSLC